MVDFGLESDCRWLEWIIWWQHQFDLISAALKQSVKAWCVKWHTEYGVPDGPSMLTFQPWRFASSLSSTVVPAGGLVVSSPSSWDC